MSKNSRSGGKFSGNHTTLTPAAATVADIASKCASVYRISPGYITTGLRPARGHRRVKITHSESSEKYLLLSVRDNTSFQEIHVYVHDAQHAVDAIAVGARKSGLNATIHKN